MKTLVIKVPNLLWYCITDPLYWCMEAAMLTVGMVKFFTGYENKYVGVTIVTSFLSYVFYLVWKRPYREVKTSNDVKTISEE